MPRDTCAELIALSVLCYLLGMSRSDRQKYECNFRRKNCEDNRDGEQNQRRKQKDEDTHVRPVPDTRYFA